MQQSLIPMENTALNNQAWERWKLHRKEIKKPVRPGTQTEKGQQKLLCSYSHEIQEGIISHSITCGYMGLFHPKNQPQLKKEEVGFIERQTDRSWADGL